METDMGNSLFNTSKELRKIKSSNVESDLSKAAFASRESAIKSHNVSIVALSGQEISNREVYEGQRKVWLVDRHPIFETEVMQDNTSLTTAEKTSWMFGDMRVWGYLQESIEKINSEDGKSLDIHNLTPIDAIDVIKRLIRDNLNYDDVAGLSLTEENVRSKAYSTIRPDVANLFLKNWYLYRNQVKNVEKQLDIKTADQVLDSGYAICRHVAAMSSLFYQMLRERQSGPFLNGTYLLFHDEEKGQQSHKGLVEDHAYNVLYVTTPGENGKVDLSVSVVDLTWYMSDGQNIDYTWKRMSQACSSISEYGYDVGLRGVQKKVIELADESAKRLELFFKTSKVPFRSKNGEGVNDFIDDYLSLLSQGSSGEGGVVLDKLFKVYKDRGLSRTKMLLRAIEAPVVTTKFVGTETRRLRPDWLREVNKHIALIDFNDSDRNTYILYEKLKNYIYESNEKDIKDGGEDYILFVGLIRAVAVENGWSYFYGGQKEKQGKMA